MTFRRSHCGTRALTLVELLIVLWVIAILAAILLAARSGHPPHRPHCINNLKQIGLAFRTWTLDNNDHFPMQVSTNEGGTLELANGPNAFAHFTVMSNELSTPRILICPEDSKRTAATNFGPDFNNRKLSYFVSVNAEPGSTNRFLTGDRNLTNGLPVSRGFLELTAGQNISWTRETHQDLGYVCFSDGSAHKLTTGDLRKALTRTPGITNLLSMPWN